MPKMGDAMEEGTLLKWLKSEGEEVSEGDPIAEIETDKVTMELEAEDAGTLAQLIADEGQDVPVGDAIAFIQGEGEEVPERSEGGAKEEAKEGGEEDGGGAQATATETEAPEEVEEAGGPSSTLLALLGRPRVRGGGLRSGTSSPSPWINAIASPTGTSWPSSAISCASVPSSSASSSIVTLSVSISAMGSPSETSSPSLLSHLRRVPSSIASPILGIMTSGTLLLLLVQNPAGRVGNLLLAGEGHQLEVAGVRPRDLGTAHPLHGSIKRVEGPILDNRRHLARHPEPPPLLLDSHGPVRLLYGLDDCVLVERPQRSQVYDLGLEAVLGERICGPQAQVDLTAVGDERDVRALAGDAGFAEGYCVVTVFDFALRPV